jgi:hypothetical protein
MGGLYDILETYRQQNDPRFIYEGLYEEPAYTGPNLDPMYDMGARQFGNMERGPFGVPKQATGIMQQAPTLSDLGGITPSYGVANEQDAEQVDSLTGEKRSGGILDLIMSVAVPGYGFLKNIGRGGLEGIRGLNQRLQQSDFGQSDNFAEFLKIKRDREALARDPDVFKDARNITSNLKRTADDKVIDRGRGNRPGGSNYSAPSKPQRSFSSDYSEAQRARKF